jgi:plasmid stability protein
MGKRNLTIALDEELLLEARVLAAKRRTSVNEMVRQHLENLVGSERRRRAAWAQVRSLVEEPRARAPGPLPSRQEIHER